MHGTFFYIGLGLGLAVACGLRPFLPVLLAGALAAAKALGVSFAGEPFRFLQSGWWLLVVAVAFALAYALQLLGGLAPLPDGEDGRRASPLAASLAGLALGGGAVLFAGTLAAHHDVWWPGLVGGLAAVAFTQRATLPVFARARSRLADRAAREALVVYLDGVALLLAALVCLLHPLGYVALALLAWFAWRGRARGEQKYAGLRVLRR